MNREILFRGKSIDHLGWEFGCLIQSFGKWYIGNTVGNYQNDWCRVIPETVGQFTGLTDKNGVRIFEGDTLEADDKSAKVFIKYLGGQFVGINMDMDHPIRETANRNWFSWIKTGNIHDNK